MSKLSLLLGALMKQHRLDIETEMRGSYGPLYHAIISSCISSICPL